MRCTIVLAVALALALPASAAELWNEYAPYARAMEALPPTPEGEGHLGEIPSGQFVQLRFATPDAMPEAYWVTLGNIVAYTGQGQTYQTVLRRDSAEGPVVYEGPVISTGDGWNEQNRHPIDLTQTLSAADCQRGYLDLFVTGLVTGDDWTIYRQSGWRRMGASAAILTPELRRRKAANEELARRGVRLLPVPKEAQPGPGSLTLERVVLGADDPADRFAAQSLREAGARPPLTVGVGGVQTGRLWLCQVDRDESLLALLRQKGFTARGAGRSEGYSLEVRDSGAVICGDDAAGLFYGVQTLCQLLRREGDGFAVPAVSILDWPSYPLRGFQYDLARGQTINLEYMQRMIRESARHKLNAIMIYMEDDYRFAKYPFLGREGTLDKAKALELSRYAEQYHVMLIPQYESLGHAGAQLSHPEMADLREAGNAWVYCTCEPKTWEFLDAAFAELAEAFPNSRYLHVGGDEFEMAFGLCPRCKAIVDEQGYEGLYALHMNKLYDLCRKYDREMLFWPSHQGPSDELSYLTLKARDMTRDCIPTEWIYHGPAAYPEIAQYQEAGFRDVFVCPAVVDYSVIWPEYPMTFRGVGGFYQAGAEKSCGGALCTTWELMYGGVYENSWYGMIYAAECGWSLGQTPKADYDRRFAASWFGITEAAAAELIDQVYYQPYPMGGKLGFWNSMFVKQATWAAPAEFRRKYMQRYPQMAETAQEWEAALDAALGRVGKLRGLATRNELTLDYAEVGLRLMRQLARRSLAFEAAASQYGEARERLAVQDVTGAETALRGAATALSGLLPEYEWLRGRYQYAVDHCGHWQGDVDALARQMDGIRQMADTLTELVDSVNRGETMALRQGATLGLGTGAVLVAGTWSPQGLREEYTDLTLDVTAAIKGPGTYRFLWQYTHGAHALRLRRNALLCNGQPVAEDVHEATTGASDMNNTYTLSLEQFEPGARYELVATISGHGGTDSYGEVLTVPD